MSSAADLVDSLLGCCYKGCNGPCRLVKGDAAEKMMRDSVTLVVGNFIGDDGETGVEL